jgi:Asp-tRNA(Asn)/Glu-tRNA(Gln) amidotransferase A subunit family amidase
LSFVSPSGEKLYEFFGLGELSDLGAALIDPLVVPNCSALRQDQWCAEFRGDNSQIIVPHTRQPAFTVPMGFTADGFPAGLQFLGRMFDEPTLIKLVYSYEQGTQHREAPVR